MNASILIGICTSNDDKTLDGLLEQCFHAKFTYGQSNSGIQIDQIIVVSSGSTDQSNMILDQYKTKYSEFEGFQTIIETKRKGKVDAVNQILKLNQSEFIIFVPADVEISFMAIDSLIRKILSRNSIGVVSGKPIPNLGRINSKKLKNLLLAIWILHNETLKYATSKKFNSHSSGELMIMKSGIVSRIPDHIINDDAYIAVKIKSKGYEIEYQPKAIVKIDVPLTLVDYIVQRKRIIYGHNQLGTVSRPRSRNFKILLKMDPMGSLKILKNLLRSPNRVFGLIYATVIELRIELDLLLSKNPSSSQSRFVPKWRRINNQSSIDFGLIAD